ncbi:calcium-binding protein [Zavarzinia aquatilis]|uniref:Calcium-binding protein n=1 Tax=Zavarzinia aquatilis TaxID=2211142 RepID=A0A317E1T4_9PROT|nr:calcium-binding protein [Zavarzinia aquatilis]PWR20374.1 hypothetical protein DKG74_15320 [Zavarzinia aquatilis]
MATFRGTTGVDSFLGKAGVADIFQFKVAELQAGDNAAGGNGAGSDRLSLLDGGLVDLTAVGAGLSGIETIALSASGNHLILIEDMLVGGVVSITSGVGDDTVDASAFSKAGRISVTFGQGNDTMLGGAGSDLFRVDPGNLTAADTISGGLGTDNLSFTSAANIADSGVFVGVTGIDKLQLAAGAAITNVVTISQALVDNSDAGSLLILGGAGNDTVHAEDVLGITFDPGTGSDTLIADWAVLRLAANSLSNDDHFKVGGGYIELTAADNYSIQLDSSGDPDADQISGFGEVHMLTGGTRLSLSSFLGSTMAIVGSKGNDIIDTTIQSLAFEFTSSYSITLGAGDDTVDTGYTPQGAVFGNPPGTPSYAIVITVGASQLTDADHITHHSLAGIGWDYGVVQINTGGKIGGVAGLSGITDLRFSGIGNSLTLTDTSAAGFDWVKGGSGDDKLDGRAVTAAHDLAADLGGGDDSAWGGAGNDVLIGGNGDDALRGLAGDDSLTGGNGADLMVGGIGNDTYTIDAADDVIERDGEGTDTILAVFTYTLAIHFENLTLTGNTAINGTGNAAGNLIVGNGAANVLYGLDGNDTLKGGAGDDQLFSGNGFDKFAFAPGGGHDTADYDDAYDYMDVSAYGYHNFAEFQAGGGTISAVNGNADTKVQFNTAGDSAILIGTTSDHINTSDFIFAA